MTAPLSLLVVADDPLARIGLASLLDAQPGLVVTGQLPAMAAHRHAPGSLELLPPDALVWDVGENRLESPFGGGVPILALISDAGQVGAALSGGARGVLSRDGDPSRFGPALVAMDSGLLVMDPGFADAALGDRALGERALGERAIGERALGERATGENRARKGRGKDGGRAVTEENILTPREQEVLELVARGMSNGLVAKRLQISEHTVRFHLKALLLKLGAATRTEAVVRAARAGWLTI